MSPKTVRPEEEKNRLVTYFIFKNTNIGYKPGARKPGVSSFFFISDVMNARKSEVAPGCSIETSKKRPFASHIA